MITLKQLKSKLEKDFGWGNLQSDDNKWFVDNLLKDTIQAIEVIHCCTELQAIEDLKDFAYNNCQLHNTEQLDEIIERL
tara:strand:- start:792 stop:1028 length:237 start_codon:yes stop_codon:yes gene_type:complete